MHDASTVGESSLIVFFWVYGGGLGVGENNAWNIGQSKHQTLFATQTQTQHNLIFKANQMCRICYTLISHWPKNLGYVGFEFTLQLRFSA